MSTDLHRLVDSVLVPGFDGTTVPEWLARRLEGGLAGVCWFGQNVYDGRQARALADELHAVRDDVLVLSDEEGGTVTRLEREAGSSWPGHAALGHVDDESLTEAVAAELGAHARAAGVDLVLAPVVDVNSDPDNPVIGVRSFGADPDLVSRHGVAFVRGLQAQGVAACAKHYPGHGATRTDSHLELPRVDADAATVRRRDLAPFGAAVAAGVRCVMTAHVLFPALDDTPATMSPRLLGLLREELGFDGVVASDALDMKAVSAGVGRGPGAVRALAAGVDLVCIGNPCFPEPYDSERVLDEVADAVVSALERGDLDRTRVEEASRRVAALGSWAAANRVAEPVPSAREAGTVAARRALDLRGDVTLAAVPLLVQVTGQVSMAAGVSEPPFVEVLRTHYPALRSVTAGAPEDVPGPLAPDAEVVVLVGHRRDADVDRTLHAVLAARPDAVVVYTGVPTPADVGTRTIHCYGGGRASAQVAVSLLTGGER